MSSVPLRLAAFAVVLVLSLGGGFVLGNVVGPLDQGPSSTGTYVDTGPDHGGSGVEHDVGGGS